ncbi:MAG: YncE family protein [Candidatus Acidiferrales bacterium]
MHVFVSGQTGWAEDAKSPISLGHSPLIALGGILPAAAGIGVTADGKKLVIANYEHDSISVIDVPSRTKTTELDLRPLNGLPGGEFPFWVAIRGNSTAFVTSERDREVVVVDISTPTPFVSNRIPLKGQPIRLILNKKQTRLYVAEGSSDAVAVIGAGSLNVLEEINTTAPPSVFDNRHGFKGSSPNSLALSQDETTLYVTNGGANSLAVIRLGNGAGETKVIGVIPTGWYPNSVSVSSDGSTLYVVNGKSNAGPNPQNCRDKGSLAIGHGVGPGAENACNAANQYVWQLTKAGLITTTQSSRRFEAVSHSARYKDSTLIFVLEDDAQDGPDHVDAHRSILLIAGPYVKQGAVISKKFTTVSVISTIVDILGIEHLGLNDADAEPMADCFGTRASKWTFNTIIPEILKTSTTLPLPVSAKNVQPAADKALVVIYSKPLHDAAWWAEQTEGFDFSVEDRLDAVRYNQLLWRGIMGEDRPYPAARSGLDLRRNREVLLKQWKQALPLRTAQGT